MNFCGFSFDTDTRGQISRLAQSGRLPHAVIIESKSDEQAQNLAALLSAYAVCESGDRPCGECRQCKNALANAHADISYLKPDSKSKSGKYSIDQMRALAVDAQVRPNDARAKVYIFKECDKRLQEVTQNAFLKLLEEPPQQIYFFLLVKNVNALLPTIRSRCTVIRAGGEEAVSDEARESAKAIVTAMLSPREYDLLLALTALTDKTQQAGILLAVKNHLRDALVTLSGGNADSDPELARRLASKLTRKKIIELIELNGSCDYRLKQNSNITLLTTWLCGEYRRIIWQR